MIVRDIKSYKAIGEIKAIKKISNKKGQLIFQPIDLRIKKSVFDLFGGYLM